MKAKRIIFGLLACVTLLAVSCEPNNSADGDPIFEEGIEKGSVTPHKN